MTVLQSSGNETCILDCLGAVTDNPATPDFIPSGRCMGNFYTNVAVKADADSVKNALRARRRIAYVASMGAVAIVVDRESDTQNLDALSSLALTLSSALSTTALASLNHDDDALILGLYDSGALVQEYGWSNSSAFEVPKSDRAEFIAQVGRRFAGVRRPRPGPPGFDMPNLGFARRLALWVLAALSKNAFAIRVHQDLVADMGLPEVCAGAGFKYVSRGEFADLETPFERV